MEITVLFAKSKETSKWWFSVEFGTSKPLSSWMLCFVCQPTFRSCKYLMDDIPPYPPSCCSIQLTECKAGKLHVNSNCFVHIFHPDNPPTCILFAIQLAQTGNICTGASLLDNLSLLWLHTSFFQHHTFKCFMHSQLLTYMHFMNIMIIFWVWLSCSPLCIWHRASWSHKLAVWKFQN